MPEKMRYKERTFDYSVALTQKTILYDTVPWQYKQIFSNMCLLGPCLIKRRRKTAGDSTRTSRTRSPGYFGGFSMTGWREVQSGALLAAEDERKDGELRNEMA